jgi:CubicO group peptidase (beta-lactamase class C family)
MVLSAGLMVACNVVIVRAQSDEMQRNDMRDEEYDRMAVRIQKVESSMLQWMQQADVPGLVLGGVWMGEPAGVGSWGIRNDMMQTPVNDETVFAAASLTKPIIAYLVLQLIDAGLLRLDQPLEEILPLAELADDPRAANITVRMILSHCSGLPNWRYENGLHLLFDPGTKFQYSGEGYVWLSQALEALTGESVEALVAVKVFKPLGMINSSLVWQERFADNFAVGHAENGMAMDPVMEAEPNAAASLLTTARDYSMFLAAALKGKYLSDQSQAAWLTPQIEIKKGVSWGLGWGLQETAAGKAIFQWGDNAGYKGFVTANVQESSGLVVFTNSDNGMALMDELVTTAMGTNQPGFEWLGYESFNSPRREVRRILERVLENEGPQATINEYRSLKRRYPAEAFQEGLLNALGYSLMAQQRFEDAISVFALNVEEYPDEFNPYDSLGEAYMRHGDVERAIENYERSIQLNPDNTNGVQKLSELRKKPE